MLRKFLSSSNVLFLDLGGSYSDFHFTYFMYIFYVILYMMYLTIKGVLKKIL